MSRNSILAINFDYALLEYYKKLSLSENEVITILMIRHLLKQENLLITADLLSIKMNMSTGDIDQILVSLMNKNLINYVTTKKGLETSLEPLEKRLTQLYQIEINKSSLNSTDENNKIIDSVYEVIEKTLGRTLSPIEFSLIDEWVSNGYSEDEILAALKESISKGKYSLKSVDRILLKWQARNDIEKEGITPIKENWNKNLEKTLDDADKIFNNKK